jgi:hypothetical protein
VGWTRRHAREVGIQPIPVDFLVSVAFQQACRSQCNRWMESIVLAEEKERTRTPAPYFLTCSG